jgi:hypothetical protein
VWYHTIRVKCRYCQNMIQIYRITAVLKVETDIIVSISVSLVGWAMILVIMYIKTFKTVIVFFICDVFMDLMTQHPCYIHYDGTDNFPLISPRDIVSINEHESQFIDTDNIPGGVYWYWQYPWGSSLILTISLGETKGKLSVPS